MCYKLNLILPFLCSAVHVILSFLVSFSLLFLVYPSNLGLLDFPPFFWEEEEELGWAFSRICGTRYLPNKYIYLSGLTDEELCELASSKLPAVKTSRRDFPYVLASKARKSWQPGRILTDRCQQCCGAGEADIEYSSVVFYPRKTKYMYLGCSLINKKYFWIFQSKKISAGVEPK